MPAATATSDPMLDALLERRATVETKIEAVKATALDQNRDLTPSDLESLETYNTSLRSLDEQIAAVSNTAVMAEDIAARVAALSPGNGAPAAHRSAGELMWDVLHQGQDVQARNRYASAVRRTASTRAAEHMGTDSALTTPVAGGFGGLIVSQNVGPLIDLTPSSRPLLTALGMQSVPSAEFRRPRIVDPNLTSGVGPQGLQKSELVSKAFEVKSDPVEFQTIGGYLNVSQQVLRYTPSGLDIIVSQLLKRLARAAENAAVAELDKTTAVVPLAPDADGAAVRQAIFDASALVYANTGALATWIAMGPAGWARLGGLVDLANRPLFPLGPGVNADGSTNPSTFNIAGLGLQAVVTPAITDDEFRVGNNIGLEAYWSPYPVLEAVEPSVLGRQVAVAADLGFYTPPTTEAGTDPETDPAAYESVVRIGAAA
jgi:HK97 family phage major capsid protein